jgi:hypothetical protein
MNALLEQYAVSIEFPSVSGAEQLEMLQLRDRILEIESSLSEQEKEQLSQADRRLIQQASQVILELSQFLDLAATRRTQEISAERWWWYLDVLAQIQENTALSRTLL